MPVWAFLDELRLTRLGLRNYWGYNPYSFMAPDPRYAVADPMAEFRAMVEALHGAGIEVVLDVVLNHTAETDHLRADALAARPRQRHLLPARSRRPQPLSRLGRLRQQPQPGPSARAAAGHGCAPPLGRAGCRRLPLRPRPRPRPRPRRRLPARRGAAAGDRPGPGAGRPQADRRALGPGPGRLPAGPVPAALRDVERPLPRLRAPVLARRRGRAAGARRTDARLGRPLRGRRPPPLGQRQPRHQP